MKFNTTTSVLSSSYDASEELCQKISAIDSNPDLIMYFGSADHNWGCINDCLKRYFPTTRLFGASSCLGLMSDEGFLGLDSMVIGAAVFSDCPGKIGVGASFTGTAQEQARAACKKMLINCKRQGELPDLIWLSSSPGHEEDILAAIREYFGTNITIYGGSCADNKLTGEWKITDGESISNYGTVMTGFFLEKEPLTLFHCGFVPTQNKAIVTLCEGREIIELNNEPASVVFDMWTKGIVSEKFKNGENNILAESTLSPLGRVRGEVHGIPYYLLSHPESITKRKGIRLFSNIIQGEEVVFMSGSVQRLQDRAGEVVEALMRREKIESHEVAGALIVYCAGCMLCVNEHSTMNTVVKSVKKSLGDVPFIGVFTFGEQGQFFWDKNLHGNLMISVTLFRK